jgi:hypothetical protein
MKNEAYRYLDYEEIVTKHHYCFDDNDEFVLLPSNHPCIGEKANKRLIYEKISLEDFRILNDNEIITREHFQVQRDSYGNLRMYRCCNSVGLKSDDVRKEYSSLLKFNLYAREENKFNFGKFDFLKDIEL